MKKAFLFTPALLALSISTISNAHAYNQVYVFGDSLSDGGNKGRYTTDQKPGSLYDEYLSKKLTGEDLVNSNKDDGTNYAVGGATAIGGNNTTENQLNNYLAKNKHADPNGIYIYWVGGNDIGNALENLQFDPDGAKKSITQSANATADQITQLVNNGAGLIIAPTVPDVGTTSELLEKVLIDAFKKAGITDEKIIKEKLQEVRAGINSYDTPSDATRDAILDGTFQKVTQGNEENYRKLLAAYNAASTAATSFTDDYNRIVDEEISKSHGNILRSDINTLLKEIIADPKRYGFDNTLGYGCAVGVSAADCKSTGQAGYDGSKKFLFSDGLHPSPEMHKIAGQYIESIYVAPSLVMMLNQINRDLVNGTRASLDGHLQQLRYGGNDQGKIGVFGSYTGTRNDTFTLGADYQLTDKLLLGVLYSNDKTERSPVSNFTYSRDANVAAVYGLWNLFDRAWLNGDLHYAHINYDSLIRSIQLGEATRRETGSTTGKQWGARFSAGWDIPVTNIVTTSPVIQFAWDKGGVKGYRESGHNSTTMHFDSDQNYTSKIGTLGWRVDAKLGRFNPYASVQFNHQFGDTQYQMRSAINSTKTSFVIDSNKQSKNWRQYTLGTNVKLFGNVRGYASVTRNDGNSQEPNYNYTLGVNASF
ncbi:MAG: autotransporter domain-containing protein [Enterobacteriaceae bacterium]|jgi:outer membrane lipase/esterase|nr:autotransporter domain-containing protein [Enterobacteriaceae bacterium]